MVLGFAIFLPSLYFRKSTLSSSRIPLFLPFTLQLSPIIFFFPQSGKDFLLTPSSICFLILCFLPLYSLWIQITSTRTRVHHVHPPTQTSSTLHNGLNPERCCSPPCLASKYVISNISFYNKGFWGPSPAFLVLWVMKLYQIIEIYLEIPTTPRTITKEDTTITFF